MSSNPNSATRRNLPIRQFTLNAAEKGKWMQAKLAIERIRLQMPALRKSIIEGRSAAATNIVAKINELA